MLVICISTPTGDFFTSTTISGKRIYACEVQYSALWQHMAALSAWVDTVAHSSNKFWLNRVSVQFHQWTDISNHAGALKTFDINCCGMHVTHQSYCAILEKTVNSGFLVHWYNEEDSYISIPPLVCLCVGLTFSVTLQQLIGRVRMCPLRFVSTIFKVGLFPGPKTLASKFRNL